MALEKANASQLTAPVRKAADKILRRRLADVLEKGGIDERKKTREHGVIVPHHTCVHKGVQQRASTLEQKWVYRRCGRCLPLVDR